MSDSNEMRHGEQRAVDTELEEVGSADPANQETLDNAVLVSDYRVVPSFANPYEPVGEYAEHEAQNRSLFSTCQQACTGAPDWEAVVNATPQGYDRDERGSWRWSDDGRLKLVCPQPLVHVPVVQEIHRRDKIIEVPKVDVVDLIQPVTYNQSVEHPVPQIRLDPESFEIEIPNIKEVEKELIVPIVTGYTHKFIPKWEVREVPRPVVKYIGTQETVEVDIPQVKFVDKVVEKEVVVDTVEKKVPKVVEVIKEVEEVKYVWKPIEKIVHVERYVPKFDVNLECPAPLLVPYTVTTVRDIPATVVRKMPASLGNIQVECEAPQGTTRVPQAYIDEYTKKICGQNSIGTSLVNACSEPIAQFCNPDQPQDPNQQPQPNLHQELLRRYEEQEHTQNSNS